MGTMTPPSVDPLAAQPVVDPTDRVSRRTAIDLRAGTLVGEYEITGKLGQGGMGVVYSATHPVIGKKAAVKVLRKNLCADAEAVERFIQEARAVNQIGHPNIVDIFAFGTLDDERSYLVMELLAGESLQARLRRGPLSREELCHLADGIARALEAAHAHKIIHRDLKPENVFLHEVRGERPIVKLLDFGIAKLADTEDQRTGLTRTGALMGTPMYISPEQARGYAIDYRADIYSLGVMLFEMTAGRTPFFADNAMDMVAKQLFEAAPRLSSVVPETPPVFDDLVASMLDKDANNRPSLARVREVLEQVRTGFAERYTIPDVPRHMPSMQTASVRPTRRSRAPIVLAFAIVLVATAITFIAIKSMRSPPTAPAAAPAATATAAPAPAPAPAAAAAAAAAAVPDPAAATAPVPATRAIKLTLTAGSGILTVDGTRVSSTPASSWELALSEGEHRIEIRASGYHRYTSTITVTADTTLPITLERARKSFKPSTATSPTPTTDDDDELLAPPKPKDKKP
jgi:tRNA A-37 threonylcarbamoyl transferase component Bud32